MIIMSHTMASIKLSEYNPSPLTIVQYYAEFFPSLWEIFRQQRPWNEAGQSPEPVFIYIYYVYAVKY
jgi:hypothetical protein